MLLYTRLAPPKVPKKRSRAGCTYCKEKKKKCDEARPSCLRCSERGLDCTYEPVRPRQRRKRDSTTSNSTAACFLAQIKAEFPSRRFSIGSHDSSDSRESGAPTQDWRIDQNGQQALQDVFLDPDETSPVETNFQGIAPFPPPDLATLSPVASLPCEFFTSTDLEETEPPERTGLVRRHTHVGIIAPPQSRLPDLAMISPVPVISPLLEFRAPAFTEFSEKLSRRALVDHFCNVLSHLIVFREETGNPFQQLVLPLTQKSSPVMNAIYALASAHLEYRGVGNGEKSVYFHNQAIQGLAKLIEYDDKVQRNELLATIILLVYYEVLVQKGRSNIVDGHLKGALTIMCRNPEPSDPTSVFLERAFRFYDVIAALSFGTAPLSTAPAAGCLLPFPPLGAPAASPLSNVDTLLGMATTLWPIIHRLSNLLSLKTELERALRAGETPSKVAVLRTEFETTSKAIEVALDQWQPCLPPNFVPDATFDDILDRAPTASTTLGNPTGTVGGDASPADADSDARAAAAGKGRIHSILHNALAYRHSAFVYLYRTIFELPRSDRLVQLHAHVALRHCVATVAYAGPMGALLWPLFVAACEAVTDNDRALASRAFAALDRRQGMTNIERAWDIVREVWRRADRLEMERLEAEHVASMGLDMDMGKDRGSGRSGLGAAGMRLGGAVGTDGRGPDLWRRISEEMGVNIVFG